MLVVLVELVREWPSPNALAAFARPEWIPALDHKALDISVKLGAVVVAAVFFYIFDKKLKNVRCEYDRLNG